MPKTGQGKRLAQWTRQKKTVALSTGQKPRIKKAREKHEKSHDSRLHQKKAVCLPHTRRDCYSVYGSVIVSRIYLLWCRWKLHCFLQDWRQTLSLLLNEKRLTIKEARASFIFINFTDCLCLYICLYICLSVCLYICLSVHGPVMFMLIF